VGADLTVETIGSLNGLRRLEPEWTYLWKRAPSPRVTLAHWWVLAFWTHVASACPLRVVVVRDHGRPVLIAPLMDVETVRGPVRERWLQTIGSYRSGPADILCPEPEPYVLDAMWRQLDRDRRWDCVALWQVPAGSPTLPALLASAAARSMACRLLRDDPGYVVPSASGWPAFEAGLDRKLRENVRRRRRKLEAAHGALEFRRIATPDDLAAARPALAELATRTWAHRKGVGLFSFHHALMDEAARRGELALELLLAGGRPIAYELNFVSAARVLSLAIGYDEDYAGYGPGHVLRWDVLRRFFADGSRSTYDFMAGGSEHKAEWAPATEDYVKLYLYRNTLRAHALCAGHRAGAAMRQGGVPELLRGASRRLGHAMARRLGRGLAPRLPRRRLWIHGHPLDVEVAASERARARGLSFRRSLGRDAGMLFVCGGFPVEVRMDDASIPLDVAFLGPEGDVLGIHPLAPMSHVPVRSEAPVAYFLEVNRGWFDAHGVTVGDRIPVADAAPAR
jgi:uncharacterized membrane protein (UPF0127 family)/CelD/BcsL family acetyltransferase involved in cellulose biosynthesis